MLVLLHALLVRHAGAGPPPEAVIVVNLPSFQGCFNPSGHQNKE